MDNLDMGMGLGRSVQTASNMMDPDFQTAQILRRIEEQNMMLINQNNEIIMLLKAINYKMPPKA